MPPETSEQAPRPGLLRFWPWALCILLLFIALALFLAGPRARAPGPERPGDAPAAQRSAPSR
jgi:hypothetical protein